MNYASYLIYLARVFLDRLLTVTTTSWAWGIPLIDHCVDQIAEKLFQRLFIFGTMGAMSSLSS
jgi:hypothetical protein